MSDRGKYRVPVPETVFLLYRLHVIGLKHIGKRKALRLAISNKKVPSAYDILILKLFFKPLVDLISGLRALYYFQPVTAGALRVLRRQYIDSVPVLELIVDIYEFSVYPGSHHAVADGAVNGVREIDGSGTLRQCLYIAFRSEAVHIVHEEIQVALKEA